MIPNPIDCQNSIPIRAIWPDPDETIFSKSKSESKSVSKIERGFDPDPDGDPDLRDMIQSEYYSDRYSIL